MNEEKTLCFEYSRPFSKHVFAHFEPNREVGMLPSQLVKLRPAPEFSLKKEIPSWLMTNKSPIRK